MNEQNRSLAAASDSLVILPEHGLPSREETAGLPLHRETHSEPSKVNRRTLLELMAASTALALGSGCDRKPPRKIVSLRNRLIHGYDAVDLDIVSTPLSCHAPGQHFQASFRGGIGGNGFPAQFTLHRADIDVFTRFSLNHTYERMNVQDVRLYNANISQLTAVYQFNVRTFFRSIIQFVNYNYNPSNYTFDIDSEYKRFFTQLLFSYKINPRTVLFLGYSDNYQGDQDIKLTQSNRTFFVKLGYAWVL